VNTVPIRICSVDGGVVWINVPPGDPILHGFKPEVDFDPVRITCGPNVLINTGPPPGLPALNRGSGYDEPE
jgi:hypothetical protein